MTGLSVVVDRQEYSLYDPNADSINVTFTITGAQAGDTISADLVRLDGYGSVLSASVSLASSQSTASLVFALDQARDADGHLVCRHGQYQVQAIGTPTTVSANSTTFYVSLISVEEMKAVWLQGVPLHSAGQVGPVLQPQLVTGVTLDIPSHHLRGQYELAYTAGSPGTLTWNGGTAVPVPAVPSKVILPFTNNQDQDHVVATIAPNMLPGTSVTETIVVDDRPIDDYMIRRQLDLAQGFLEAFLYTFLEPTYSGTDPNTLAQGPESSVFTGWCDHTAIPQTYYRPRDFMRWMALVLPYNRLLKVHNLTGYFNATLTLEITLDWIVWNETNAEVELVPSNGAVVTWQFYESAMLQFLFIYNSIPSFWHYWITSGLRHLYEEHSIVREALAKKAAVDIIHQAGLAYSAGRESYRTERDRVVSDTRFERPFPGAALAQNYWEWLFGKGGDLRRGGMTRGYLTRIRQRLIGPQFVVV